MKTLIVLVFVASLASDLCNARIMRRINKKKPEKRKKEKDGGDEGLLVIYTTNFPLSEDLRILKS